MSTPKVYVILVNFRGWEDTIECLESLFRMDYDDFRVIVIDNGSGDNSLTHLRSWADGGLPARQSLNFSKPYVVLAADQVSRGGVPDSPLIFIESLQNLGFAAGNNLGLKLALSDSDAGYFWLLNNDTLVSPGALAALVDRSMRVSNAGMIGSTLRYYHAPGAVQSHGGSTYNKWLGWNKYVALPEESGLALDPLLVESKLSYVSAASMLVTRRFLETVGLMSEEYFLYFEELDWAARARGRFSLAFAPQSVVYHKAGSSIKRGSARSKKRTFSEYYLQRNKLRFTRKYFPYALPSVYFGLMLAATKSIVQGDWARAGLIGRILLGRHKPVKP